MDSIAPNAMKYILYGGGIAAAYFAFLLFGGGRVMSLFYGRHSTYLLECACLKRAFL